MPEAKPNKQTRCAGRGGAPTAGLLAVRKPPGGVCPSGYVVSPTPGVSSSKERPRPVHPMRPVPTPRPVYDPDANAEGKNTSSPTAGTSMTAAATAASSDSGLQLPAAL